MVAPIFFFMVISTDRTTALMAFPLFLIGAISDYYDGWYARKYQVITKFGVFIDPLADKFLTTSAFIAFNYMDILPVWMTIVIVIRDFGTTFLRLFGDSHNLPVTTKDSAKYKTAIQFTFIGYIGVCFFISKLNLGELSIIANDLIYSGVTFYLMLGLVILTLYTLYEYIRDNSKLINKLFGLE